MDQTQLSYVGEEIETGVFVATIDPTGQVQIPKSIVNEYDLAGSYIDAIVSQSDSSCVVMDMRVDPTGRFTVPKRKRDLYGIETGSRVDVEVDRVVFR